jgi:hypothetical protein
MSDHHRNLADPEYEPSDEDLARLMHEAFAGVAEAHDESLRAMRARIQRLQTEVRDRLESARGPDRR